MSVFECIVSPSQEVLLKKELLDALDLESDSIRIYHLGNNYRSRIWAAGVEKSLDLDEPLIL